jgi:RNA polymerase sigma-70 factor (ECF subfamily)
MKSQLQYIAGVVLAMTLAAGAGAAEPAKEVSIKAMPPSVVKTVPSAGDTAVDPALKEIKFTFSKDMNTNRNWSFCQISKETYPELAGEIHYLDDKRTCVLPVKLQPGKTYVIWANRAQFNNCRDAGNHPAVPYLLVFETRK